MVRYAAANGASAGKGLVVLPGVVALLQALSKMESVSVALVRPSRAPPAPCLRHA